MERPSRATFFCGAGLFFRAASLDKRRRLV
jgi:hypothetical protein